MPSLRGKVQPVLGPVEPDRLGYALTHKHWTAAVLVHLLQANSHCLMGPLRTIFDTKKLLEFAKLGCYLQYDLFGTEFFHYQFHSDIDMPNDSGRIARIRTLIDEGYEERILMGHDVHTKNRLMRYGGQRYSHIFENTVPKMLIRGISQDKTDKILTANPKRWLTFK